MAARFSLFAALVVAEISLGVSRIAHASMTVEFLAISTTNGTIVDPKHVLFTGHPGDTIRLNLFATVVGDNSDPDDDFISYLNGSFLSSFGGLHGDLQGFLVSGYNGGGYAYGGTKQDLDGDGDLEAGSN